MSNVNKWNGWYSDLDEDLSAFRYGDTLTYELGAKFLQDCNTIEDWGTGAGGFKRFVPTAIGVDGSDTPHADKKFIDLVTYVSQCDGIFMRHVLEHNYEWESILRNAVASATRKLCVVLFTPMSNTDTIELNHNAVHGVDVPDLSLSAGVLFDIIKSCNPKNVWYESYPTPPGYDGVTLLGYGEETVIYVEK